MQVRKGKIGIGLIAILFLCCACIKPQPPATPIPTKAPPATAVPSPTIEAQETVTPEPTEAVMPTVFPTEAVTPTPIETIAPTPTKIPTATPSPTETAVPSPTTAAQETVTPEPTKAVVPTVAPTEPVTPTPVPTSVPQASAEELVYHGWQSVNDLTGTYRIVFPEVFTEGFIEQAEDAILFWYQSRENPEILLSVQFLLEKDFDLLADEIGENHAMQEIAIGEKKGFFYQGERGAFFASGYLVEHFYEAFVQETDGIKPVGSLLVEFSYPKEQRDRYETEQYQYYIIPIP